MKTKTSRQRKQRKDVKLTPDKLSTIEACLKQGMTHEDIHAISSCKARSHFAMQAQGVNIPFLADGAVQNAERIVESLPFSRKPVLLCG